MGVRCRCDLDDGPARGDAERLSRNRGGPVAGVSPLPAARFGAILLKVEHKKEPECVNITSDI